MSKFLITGTAGFIGFHLANALLGQGHEVVGLDNINDYYDVNLKYRRLKDSGINRNKISWDNLTRSAKWPCYRFVRMDIKDKERLSGLFGSEKFEYVIHLAAQAGVRNSRDNPDIYVQSNIVGFFNILEACRHFPVKNLIFASSSSVYGNNDNTPFGENDNVDHPISLYAATKKSNELMAYAYSHLYKIPTTGLRLFTVYGPWGRPDMAVFKFTKAILNKQKVQVYGEGRLLRDFTYIDDVIAGITSILEKLPSGKCPAIMNIGNNCPVTISTLLSEIEQYLKIHAVIEYLPVQPGDVRATYADLSRIRTYCNFSPRTDLKAGIKNFCDWYLAHYS